MAVRPDRLAQHDDGTALRRLESRLSGAVGFAVGGLIAEEVALDHDFARQLARATEACAGPAEQIESSSRHTSLLYQINEACYQGRPPDGRDYEESVTVAVGLYDNVDGDVAICWRHPSPYLGRGFRTVHAHTGKGFRFVEYADSYPMIADTARRLLTEIRDAWADYRAAQTGACTAIT